MLDILSDYLNGATTPELKTSIEEAFNVFDRVSVEDNYTQTYEQILAAESDVEDIETLNAIVSFTKDVLRQILKEHGITCISEISIHVMVTLINGILDIQEYLDPGLILQTASMEGSSLEILAEVLAIVTDICVNEIMVNLEEVNQFTITRIKEMSNQQEEAMSVESRIRKQEHIDLFKKFCQFSNVNDLFVGKMIANGIDVGYPFLIYANTIGRQLETVVPKRAAEELIAMALISSDGKERVRAIIKEHIDKYIANIDKVTLVDIAVSDIMLRFQK